MRPMDTPRRARAQGLLGDRGMTLIELMIVLLILSLTSDAIFSLMSASLKTYWKGDVATQVQQGARISADRMVRDLRQGRILITGVTRTVGATSFTFNTACSPSAPQISAILLHTGSVTLADSSVISATDANPTTGAIPYDGWDVSYYLAAASNSATPNTTGPYLIRASYDLVGSTGFTFATVASNVTGLALSAGGSCPTAASLEFTLTVTASQNQTGQNVSSTTVVTDDVRLREQ